MEINTSFILRPPTSYDAFSYFKEFDDADVMRFIGSGEVRDISYYESLIEEQISSNISHGYCLNTILVGSEVAGFIGMHNWDAKWGPSGEIEMGWRLGRRFWGRGLALSAAQAYISQAGKTDLVAMIQRDNQRSMVLATRLGFVPGDSYTDPSGSHVYCFRRTAD